MNLISVIVPIYGVEKYLNKCVESIVNQTYTNLEIILVDDESPDNCPKICDEWAKKDSRVKVIHKKNGGLSDARNAGLKICTGDYISFIDADDFIHHDMLNLLADVIKRDGSDIAICGVQNFCEDENIADMKLEDHPKSTVYDTQDAEKELLLCRKIKQHVWNRLYKRDTINGIMFDYGKCHEDVFWSYKIFGRASKVSVIPQKMYYYLQRSTSIMGEKYSPKRADALEALMLQSEYIKEHFPALYSLSLQTYISVCMYQYQLILSDKSVDSNKKLRKNIIGRFKKIDFKEAIKNTTFKQRLMFRMFRLMPQTVCAIRNKFGIGR